MYLIIMQGPPGSGKSTFGAVTAKAFGAVVCSTDDYHYEGSLYIFKPERAKEYHELNQARARELLASGRSVVVDNTNIKAWEARPYVRMGVELGAEIVFVRCTGARPNVHGVPEERVAAMRSSMEELSVQSCINAVAPWEAQNE